MIKLWSCLKLGAQLSESDSSEYVSTFDIERAIETQLASWKARLVSFDGNNRQIFYRTLKVGSVDFDDQYADQNVLENLISGRKIKVSQIYPSLITKLDSREIQDLLKTEDDDELAENENSITGYEQDLNKAWAIRLKKFEAIYRKSKTDSEEKNIETCFLAESFCTWEIQTPGGAIPNAPLIFHGIKIESISRGNNDFSLEKKTEGTINDALSLYFQIEHGIPEELFDIPATEIYPNSPSLVSLISAIGKVVPGFKVNTKRILGNFSFAQYPMVVDLDRIKRKGTSHTVIGALSKIGKAKDQLERTGSEETLEQLSIKDPVLEHLIFPADSSQHEAISAIAGGKNIVIQGPPGTGKSQTIANVIAECVASKKSILFVAEKKAAIDAVTERLNDVGLGSIVLNLHDEPDKKVIAQTLTQILKQYSGMVEPRPAEVSKLYDAKKNLQKRWEWLNLKTDLVDSHGNPYTIYNLLREVGERGAELGIDPIEGVKIFIPNIEDINSTVRDQIAACVDILYRCDYFNRQKRHESTKDLISVITTQQRANELNKVVANLHYKMQMREFAGSIEAAKALIPDVAANFQGSKAIFDSYHDATSEIAKWHFDRYAEIIGLKSLLSGLTSFRKSRDLGFLQAIFARRRELKQLGTFRSSPALSLSNKEYLNEILMLENAVTEWKRQGGEIDILSPANSYDSYRQYVGDLLVDFDTFCKLTGNSPIAVNSPDFVRELVGSYRDDSEYIRNLPQLAEAQSFLINHGLDRFIEFLDDEEISQSEASSYWLYIWFSSNLQKLLLEKGEASFTENSLNQNILDFQARDKAELAANPSRIIRAITSSLLSMRSPGFDLLTRQATLKSGHLPFRDLLSKGTSEILAIKPCFAMSPRAVSRMLPCEEGLFDVVIFDEASQIKPENAITSIYRGKQVVVAGDRHQLPPTREFTAVNANADAEDMESILDEITSMFPIQDNRGNVKPLTRHYRSNDERLISWSNFNIYKAVGEELSSFPSTAKDSNLILGYKYVDGVRLSDMSHPNEVEIDAVIELVKSHVRERFDDSLGIIGFGKRHSDRLQDAFNILERTDSDFFDWKAHWEGHRERFFIKNIENVQGDERDAIIITPGYAPNLEGNLLLRFGSLNLSGGERRLNVAASRAKKSMTLVTSLRSQDFDLTKTASRGVALFKSYVEFMERGGHLEDAPEHFSVPESPFEEQIEKALADAGLLVDCQVGESKFKIDFGIRDPKTNRYVLAVEADGATYHSSPYARERDWLRQQILEQKGWNFVRIWSTDWWENPKFQVTRVVDAYNRALANMQREPSISAIYPSKKVITPNSEFEGNPEYELLRGILAQFPNTSKEDLLSKWMAVLGLKRRGIHMLDRFESYFRQAKKDIHSVGN